MNKLNERLHELITSKESRLAFSCDVTASDKLVALTKAVAGEICVLKTHIDVVEDFTPQLTGELVDLARDHSFLLFEDRKFADIGNTVRLQYEKGVYKIADWAHYVNCHAVPGDGIIEGLQQVADAKTASDGKLRGLLLLAQMSSKGTFATGDYTAAAVEMAKRHPEFTAGFIGNGAKPEELLELRRLAGPDFTIMAPGVQLNAAIGSLGQQYASPKDAIAAGADVVIVGGGIYKASNPAAAARAHREDAWVAKE